MRKITVTVTQVSVAPEIALALEDRFEGVPTEPYVGTSGALFVRVSDDYSRVYAPGHWAGYDVVWGDS